MYIILLFKYCNKIIEFNSFFFNLVVILILNDFEKIFKFFIKIIGYGLFLMRICYLKFFGIEMKV